MLAYQLGWFPVQGWGGTLGENLLRYSRASDPRRGHRVSLAPDIRLYRSVFLEEINQDYVRTARAKGLGEGRVMWRARPAQRRDPDHHQRHDRSFPGLLAGAFLIERFFSIPGIGREVILAVERSDFPVIKAVTVYVAIATMIVNLLADLIYQRARSAGAAQMSLWQPAPGAASCATRWVAALPAAGSSLAFVVARSGARPSGWVARDWSRRGRRELCAAAVSWPNRTAQEHAAPGRRKRFRKSDYGIEDPHRDGAGRDSQIA